jgi:hypothetical protein
MMLNGDFQCGQSAAILIALMKDDGEMCEPRHRRSEASPVSACSIESRPED